MTHSDLKISVYIATSLDGFIARPDGTIDWLIRPEYTIEGEDFGYATFMASVDSMVMGRNTYEKVLSMGTGWPYAGKYMVVLSTGQPAVPDNLAGTVEVRHLSPAEAVAYLRQRGFRHVYVDGGKTIQAFLRENLVDELIITQIPVLLGQGLPLFGETGRDIRLEHVQATAFPNGFVQSTYRIAASL